jgi:hypothetical protein
LQEGEDPQSFSENVYASGMYVIAVAAMSDEELQDALNKAKHSFDNNQLLPPCVSKVLEVADERGVAVDDSWRAAIVANENGEFAERDSEGLDNEYPF